MTDPAATAVIEAILRRHPDGVTAKRMVDGLTGPGRTRSAAAAVVTRAIDDGIVVVRDFDEPGVIDGQPTGHRLLFAPAADPNRVVSDFTVGVGDNPPPYDGEMTPQEAREAQNIDTSPRFDNLTFPQVRSMISRYMADPERCMPSEREALERAGFKAAKTTGTEDRWKDRAVRAEALNAKLCEVIHAAMHDLEANLQGCAYLTLQSAGVE